MSMDPGCVPRVSATLPLLRLPDCDGLFRVRGLPDFEGDGGTLTGTATAPWGKAVGGSTDGGWFKSAVFGVLSSVSLINFGMRRATRGFRLGTHAHMTDTLTSTTDHMNERDAYPRCAVSDPMKPRGPVGSHTVKIVDRGRLIMEILDRDLTGCGRVLDVGDSDHIDHGHEETEAKGDNQDNLLFSR